MPTTLPTLTENYLKQYNMPEYKITFTETIEAETEEQAWEWLLTYISDCAHYEDVTGFNFELISEEKH